MTVAFVRVSNRKEKYEVLLRVDIEDDNAQVVSTRGGDPIVAPDGLTWANTLYSEKESIRVNEDEAEGYCIGVPDRVSSGRFSPDSRFILADFYNKNSQGGKRSIIGIIPESFDTQPYHVPITEFPPASLPNGSAPGLSNREVFFSADGMHLICVRYNQFREGEYEGDFLREAKPARKIGAKTASGGKYVVRVSDGGVEEIIMGTNPDTEGETTAKYVSRLLKPFGVKV